MVGIIMGQEAKMNKFADAKFILWCNEMMAMSVRAPHNYKLGVIKRKLRKGLYNTVYDNGYTPFEALDKFHVVDGVLVRRACV